MKKNISITENGYRGAIAKAEYMYDYLFRERPLFASPDRAAFVAYEALTQITGEPIDNDDFDREFYAAIRRDSYPSNVEHKIKYMMGWFEGFLDIEIVEGK